MALNDANAPTSRWRSTAILVALREANIHLDGFTFPGGYTDLVTAGDGDFLTADALWDFKVSVKGPTSAHTLQLLMYLLMGRRSGQPAFNSITQLGVFNPRLNAVYQIALADVPSEVVSTVSRDVIGY